MITLLVTDGTLAEVDDPIQDWANLDVTRNRNAAAAGSVDLRVSPRLVAAVRDTPQARLVVLRDGQIWCAGPIEQIGPRKWASDSGGTITISFTDDFGLVAGRRSYPDPTHAATAQGPAVKKSWTATNAEVIARALVNDNAGPGALTARRIPELVLGSLAGVGSNIDYSTRFKQLGDELRAVALAGGDLTVGTQQVGGQIVFSVDELHDVSDDVVFGPALGNLIEYEYTLSAPTATVAIVGDDQLGGSRTIVERVNTAALARWWRIETFVNGQDSSSTTAELQQAGDQALADAGEAAELSVTAVEKPDQRFGDAYDIGSIVSVQLEDGAVLTETVRAARLLAASSDAAEKVLPLIGAEAATPDAALIAYLRKLDRRLGRLETF